jgi:hypothetical protein
MSSCPGPARTPACTPWSAPNRRAAVSWTCLTATSLMPICSWPRPWRGPAARGWPSTPPAARISSGCPRPSCGASGTGSAANWTRPPATAAASSNGPPSTASTRRKPWPPTKSSPIVSLRACFVGCAAARSLPGYRVAWRWPPNRSTGPMTGSGSCVSTAAPPGLVGGQRPPGSAVSAGRSDPCLAAARHRPGRRAGSPRLCLGGPGAGAGADPGSAGLAPGRRRGRAVPTHLRHHRSDAGAWPGADRPSPAGRSAAGPHGHRARPGQAARCRPRPRPTGQQRADQPAAISRAAWPARPGAGRRLTPPER